MTSKPKTTSIVRTALILAAVCSLLIPISAMAVQQPDVITVGSGAGVSGSSIDVPVYIQDISGTALGIDQPFGSRIQAFSLKVDYSPASAVSSVTFTRAGITSSLSPADEQHASSAGSISLLDSFDETTNLIPFVSNAAAPGQEVAHLTFQLSGSAAIGTHITLTLDPALTQLDNQAGTTIESVGDRSADLALVAGAIDVTNPVPTVSVIGLLLLVLALGVVGVRFAARSL